MLAFYWALIRRIPGILFQATNNWLVTATIITFLIGVVISVNRIIGKRFMTSWQGISQWWALLPIGILLLYGIMKANYERVRQLEYLAYPPISPQEARKREIVKEKLREFNEQ